MVDSAIQMLNSWTYLQQYKAKQRPELCLNVTQSNCWVLYFRWKSQKGKPKLLADEAAASLLDTLKNR